MKQNKKVLLVLALTGVLLWAFFVAPVRRKNLEESDRVLLEACKRAEEFSGEKVCFE